MMISSPIFSYVFHFNLVMILLLGIASETTSSDSGSIIKIREPGNLGASNYSIRLDWGEIIDATENKYSITVGTIVGFLPKIYGIYQTVSSLLYPGAPKKTFLGTTTVLPKLLDETLQDLYDVSQRHFNYFIHVLFGIGKI